MRIVGPLIPYINFFLHKILIVKNKIKKKYRYGTASDAWMRDGFNIVYRYYKYSYLVDGGNIAKGG